MKGETSLVAICRDKGNEPSMYEFKYYSIPINLIGINTTFTIHHSRGEVKNVVPGGI